MIIGQSAIRFGAHQHRSSRTPKTRIPLPQNYKLLPELLSEQGYTTFNFGKADYILLGIRVKPIITSSKKEPISPS